MSCLPLFQGTDSLVLGVKSLVQSIRDAGDVGSRIAPAIIEARLSALPYHMEPLPGALCSRGGKWRVPGDPRDPLSTGESLHNVVLLREAVWLVIYSVGRGSHKRETAIRDRDGTNLGRPKSPALYQ